VSLFVAASLPCSPLPLGERLEVRARLAARADITRNDFTAVLTPTPSQRERGRKRRRA